MEIRSHFRGGRFPYENLENNERINEIAKMIALGDDSNFSLNMARELIDSKKAL